MYGFNVRAAEKNVCKTKTPLQIVITVFPPWGVSSQEVVAKKKHIQLYTADFSQILKEFYVLTYYTMAKK